LQVLRDDEVAGGAPEHDEVGQRIGAQPIRAVHRHARAFPYRIEAFHDGVVVAVLRRHDLAVDVGRHPAHLVMDRGDDRNRLPRAVDVRELERDLVNRRQPLHDDFGTEVVELQQHVVLVRPAAAAFLDLLVHRPADDVARRQILEVRRVALHEALAVAVEQDPAFAAHALGDEHAGARDAGRVELPELHVLERNSRARRHPQAVARIDERIGRRGENAAGAAGGEQRRLGLEDDDLARLHLQGHHAQHIAVGVADEVERHPLDEEVRARADVALIQRVQERMAGAVGGGARALHRLLAEIRGVPAERALVDRAVGIAIERHAEVLELVDDLRRRPAHVLDRILVAEPVRALDRVVHVPEPAVLRHVAECRADAALGGDGVRARREHFGEDGDGQPRFGELQRSAHPGAAGADDDRVELADGNAHALPHRICSVQPEIGDQQHDRDRFEQQPDSRRLDVIHQDVAHTDPCVVEQRDHEQERGEPEAAVREKAGPDE
jgi:hypothetical protein